MKGQILFGKKPLEKAFIRIYADSTKLLQKIESDASKKGMRTLKANSTITAYQFYIRNGFRIVKKSMVQMGNQKLNVYEMSKRIPYRNHIKK